MRDYTLSKEEKENFILNYTIEGDKIIINYASGKSYPTPHTKELEEDLKISMETQVKRAENEAWIENHKRRRRSTYLISFLLMILVGLIPNTFISVILRVCVCGLGCGLYYVATEKIKDYEKNKFFLENKKLFLDYITEDMNIYTNVDKKTEECLKKMIEEQKKNPNTKFLERNNDKGNYIYTPNLNTIHEMRLEELKNIKAILLENQKYNPYYSEPHSKRKVLNTERSQNKNN